MPDRIELKPNSSIVFIGGSITDADRFEPAYRPFGYGYVHFVAYRLLATYLEYNLSIINTGISGDTHQLTYKRLLSLIKEKYNCQLILIEPFMFCDDKANPAYKALQQYIHAERALAKEFDAVLVPLQELIDKKNQNNTGRKIFRRHGSSLRVGACMDRAAMDRSNKVIVIIIARSFQEDEKIFFFIDSVIARTKNEAKKIASKNSNFTLYTLSICH